MGFRPIYKNLKYMGLQPNIGTFSTKRKIDLFSTGTYFNLAMRKYVYRSCWNMSLDLHRSRKNNFRIIISWRNFLQQICSIWSYSIKFFFFLVVSIGLLYKIHLNIYSRDKYNDQCNSFQFRSLCLLLQFLKCGLSKRLHCWLYKSIELTMNT